MQKKSLNPQLFFNKGGWIFAGNFRNFSFYVFIPFCFRISAIVVIGMSVKA
jgi:hypothetical protein